MTLKHTFKLRAGEFTIRWPCKCDQIHKEQHWKVPLVPAYFTNTAVILREALTESTVAPTAEEHADTHLKKKSHSCNEHCQELQFSVKSGPLFRASLASERRKHAEFNKVTPKPYCFWARIPASLVSPQCLPVPVDCSILSVPWSMGLVSHSLCGPWHCASPAVSDGSCEWGRAGTQGGGGEINQEFVFRAEISWPGGQDASDASSSHLICDAQAEPRSKKLR